MITYLLILSSWKFHSTITHETHKPLDISSAIGVYASMKPLSMIQCTAQCASRPRCNSILFEERTKTCFLNKGVATLPNLSMQGYQYSEKADMKQQSRIEKCEKNRREEYSACEQGMPSLGVSTTPVSKVTTVVDFTSPDTTTVPTTASKITTLEDTTSPGTTPIVAIDNLSTVKWSTKALITKAANSPCPSSYIADTSFIPALCFLFMKDVSYTHQKAEDICNTIGGHLLLTASLERYNKVRTVIINSVSSSDSAVIWLDGKRSGNKASWRTSYDSTYLTQGFQPFDPNDPDDGNCIGWHLSGKTISGWQGIDCSLPGWLVCAPA